jgi:hypothetical protein
VCQGRCVYFRQESRVPLRCWNLSYGAGRDVASGGLGISDGAECAVEFVTVERETWKGMMN